MALDSRIGNKVIKNARREDASGTRVDPYPYIGIVKNNLDPTRSGRLQVWIPDLGGPEDDPKNWRTVSYASPFSGYTSTTYQSTEKPSQENKFNTVHHSYGMWFVPPDLNVQVIVLFVAGDPLRGYWVACVNPHLSHYMLPGLSGTKNVDKTTISNTEGVGEVLPVVEFNEYTKDFTNTTFYNNNKPLHIYQWDVLKEQGLNKDYFRGPLSSSSQRESPSFVFGISTPGRPVNDPADDKNYLTDLKAGKVDPKYLTVKARKGGHQFVMDDGATMGEDQLIRLRTAKGHQVLLHDTNETLYIAHAKGKSWIELAKDGSILIFSNNGIAIRTEGSIDVRADKDFNLDVGGKINIKAGTSLKLETPLIEFLAKDRFRVTSDTGTEFKVGTFRVDASSKISVKSDSTIAIQGSKILENSGGVDSLKAVEAIPTNKLPDTLKQGTIWEIKPNKLNLIVSVAPTHEPYVRSTTGVYYVPESPGIQPKPYTGKVDATQNSTTAGVQNPANATTLRSQPQAKAAVGTLSQDQTTALNAQIGAGKDYASVAADGALGKYGIGADTLKQLGYLKSVVTSNADLSNPNSWIGKDGISGVTNFLENSDIQESVMGSLSELNYSALVANGAITLEQTQDQVAGMLAVAHNLGVDAAKQFREGAGVNALDIFNQGKYAASVLAPQLPTLNAG